MTKNRIVQIIDCAGKKAGKDVDRFVVSKTGTVSYCLPGDEIEVDKENNALISIERFAAFEGTVGTSCPIGTDSKTGGGWGAFHCTLISSCRFIEQEKALLMDGISVDEVVKEKAREGLFDCFHSARNKGNINTLSELRKYIRQEGSSAIAAKLLKNGWRLDWFELKHVHLEEP